MNQQNRDIIVNEFDKIRKVVESSSLNFLVEESFYSARIHIKKKLRHDWPDNSSSPNTFSTPIYCSRNTASLPHPTQHTSSFNESGYATEILKTPTFHDAAVQKDNNQQDHDVAKVKQELNDARKNIEFLKNENKDKDLLISQAKKETDVIREEVKEKEKEIAEQSNKINVPSNSLNEKRKEIKEKEEIISGLQKYTGRREEELLKEYSPKLDEISNSLDEKRKELKRKDKKNNSA